MAQAWDAKPAGQRDGVVLGGPHAVRRHGMREPEPLRSWGAVAVPIKPRMISKDLDAGADDEVHEEHVQEVLHAQPPWKADYGRLRLRGAGVALDKGFYRGDLTQGLG